MVGLVEQLQADAVNPDVPVSTLLRKVKVAAVKLGRDDALSWVENELEGYKSYGELPDYRKGIGSTVAWNPYHGWQHIHFGDAKTADLISEVAFFEPIANYETALEAKNDGFKIPLSNDMVEMINESLNVAVPRIANSVARGLLNRITEKVRDLVLNWALELQRLGITGDGLGFSADERLTAQGAHISIGTFHGSFNAGDAIGPNSRIEVDSKHKHVKQIFGEIENAIISSIEEGEERDKILNANRELSLAKDKNTFLAAYERLIQAASNHVTVLVPFLPALGTMIASFNV